jgi:uncharacterized membrane protein YgcG
MANPLKPFSSAPGEFSREWADAVQSAINQLIGQATNPTLQKGFPALSVPTVDPTTSQIPSRGSRMSSVSTPITFTFTATSVSFFWDGTNGSHFLRIGRDDGTVVGPTNNGSPVIVTGLTTGTYYFYPYWDETLQKVVFATVQNVAVGSPPIAFTVQNFLAAQQQILRGRIPLGLLLVQTGVTLTGGTGSGSGGSGGGGAGSGGGRGNLQ